MQVKAWRLVWALAVLAGCGGSDWEGARHPVSGSVTLDGEPLAAGVIGFVPLQPGPAAQAQVEAGAYAIPASEGLYAGPHRVEINSIKETGEEVFDPAENRKVARSVNLVPRQFNAASTLRAEVVAGGTPLDFRLTTPKTKAR